MKATTPESPYLTVTQAEAYCKLDRTSLWRARRQGKLKASGYGRALRYRVEDLDEFMAAWNSNK
jgi:hypothetical protein